MPILPGKFVLFAQGRTGSTLLGDLLGDHPEVFFGHEIFQQPVRSTRWELAWLQGRHARHVVGFHVKIYQLTDVQGVADAGAWLRRLHRRGWQVIALRRENLLRHVLSNMTALAADRYSDRSGQPGPGKLHVDPDHLVHWMGVREQVGRAEERALEGIPHLALTYEHDLQDPGVWDTTSARAFEYLGLSAVPVSTNLRRQNVGGLPDLIENLAEVEGALHGTAYAKFLD
jgi:hypothetical protein